MFSFKSCMAAAVLGATAVAGAASAHPQLTDAQYLSAARCQALMSSAAPRQDRHQHDRRRSQVAGVLPHARRRRPRRRGPSGHSSRRRPRRPQRPRRPDRRTRRRLRDDDPRGFRCGDGRFRPSGSLSRLEVHHQRPVVAGDLRQGCGGDMHPRHPQASAHEDMVDPQNRRLGREGGDSPPAPALGRVGEL